MDLERKMIRLLICVFRFCVYLFSFWKTISPSKPRTRENFETQQLAVVQEVRDLIGQEQVNKIGHIIPPSGPLFQRPQWQNELRFLAHDKAEVKGSTK